MSPARANARPAPGSVEKAYLVMDVLVASDSRIGVSEIARRAGLPKTTVHRILQTLTGLGFAEQQRGGYGVGHRLLRLADDAAGVRPSALRGHLLPHMLDLFQATGHAVHLGLPRNSGVLFLDRLHGHRSVAMPIPTGATLPAHCTALGKVLLAYGGSADGQWLRRAELPVFTGATLSKVELVESELERIRQEGIAVDSGEFRDDIRCVAAPIWGPRRLVMAAISVCGPAWLDIPHAAQSVRQVAYTASRSLAVRART